MTSNIHVYDEFGELKEVIIGSPLAGDDQLPVWTPGMDEEFSWLKPETFDFLKQNNGKLWKEVDPDGFELVNNQIANYVQVLEAHGVIVHQFPDPVYEDRDYINKGTERLFPRDNFCTAGSTVVVSSLRMPWKRKLQYTALPFYTRLLVEGKCNYISTPQASTEILSPLTRKHKAEEHSILLDGGDFLVNGEDIYLGIGQGSNMLGAKFAENVFGDQFNVYPLRLHSDALHLDCTISLLRPGLGLIVREWLIDELPPRLQEYEWIEVTVEEAEWLGCNGLPLNPETVVMDSLHRRVIEKVKEAGHEVVELPYDGPSFLGGALRCSSQPVYREKA